MLNQQLIDILNSGEAWAFIGSGCSVDAGLPSWEELLNRAIYEAESSIDVLLADAKQKITKSIAARDFPKAFSVLKTQYGSTAIDDIVIRILKVSAEPGQVTKALARWPFASYATTNYDDLLEQALEPHGGWVAVGNTSDENAKISSDVRGVVWHPHGGINLGIKNLRLVLASTDYDEIYPAGSPTLSALEAVCRMKRIVFIGFGFRDPDLVMTLKRIKRLITPARPAFGFLANCTPDQCIDFRRHFNVEVIPYCANGHDHSDLVNVLDAYGAFVLDRSARFGNVSSTPDYDIDTVGLLTYNRLCLSGWAPESEAMDCITKGLVLAQLKLNSPMNLEQLTNAMPQHLAEMKDSVRRVIEALVANGDIVDKQGSLSLSARGDEVARQGKADYELARDQFRSSILSRATARCPDRGIASNIQEVTVKYLDRTCRDRGLGVAQQLAESGGIETRARAVALLQGAKSELELAGSREAALGAIHCIWDVLSAPRPEEKKYLGLLTQSYFGRQLLGLDPAAIGIRRRNLSFTVFIADSNFIIPLLAEGSIGHEYATTLYQRLRTLGCKIVTSDLLLEECVEHARWAYNFLQANGSTSPATIDAAKGAGGYRPNAFLIGYLNHQDFGPSASFKRFFAHLFDSAGEIPDETTVAESLRKREIIVQPLSDWKDFTPPMLHERDQLQEEIERRRKRNLTYRHERQVKAEAEVAVIVTKVRQREISLPGEETRDAYFLSYSRVVDNLPQQARRVCLTPESLFEWILSISEVKAEDANAIFDQLLWELSREGLDVVPRLQLLHLFHNTIDASRTKLEMTLSEYREIIRELYSVEPEKAFLDADPLDIPHIDEKIKQEVLATMEARLEEEQRLRAGEQKRRMEAEEKARKAVKDEEEYHKLKAEKKLRKAKAISRQRAAHSKHGKGKSNKPKKKS